MKTNDAPLDVLAIAAHPDDSELFAGGTLATLCQRGRRVGILDMTRGESASRGSAELRAEEAAQAARILGISKRIGLDLGDGNLQNTLENRRQVVEQIRQWRPRLVITLWHEDRHPDHRQAHELVTDAVFFANVGKFPAAGERWAVEAIAYHHGNSFMAQPRADWIVDVSATFETKLEALRAYESQFLAETGEVTYIASEGFWQEITQRARHWGHRIGAEYGEAFVFDRPAHAAHPLVAMLRD